MIKRDIKKISVMLPDGEIYESYAPIGFLSAMINKGLCSSLDAEHGAVKLPESCSFKSDFELSESDIVKKNIYIEVSGVYAKGILLVNGKNCGIVNNPNRTYLFDIADKVIVGKNTVEISCSEALSPKQALTSYGERSNEYDTSERVADYAVLNPISLYISDTAFINEVAIRQDHNDGKVNVLVTPSTVGEKNDVRIVASLSAPSGKIYFGGAYENEIKISVPDPELWWPIGYGAQPIYKLTVTLYHGADVADVFEKRIGLRTVALSQNENSVYSLSVNGINIFARGATYLRQNAILASVTASMTEAVIKNVIGANMNTLYILDENVPLPESFYDLCDKCGILIWQSLTLPYIAPPAASVFASGVTEALADNVKRLSSHSSVAAFFLTVAETEKEMMRLFKDSIEEFRAVSLRILAPVLSKCAPNTPFVSDPRDVFKSDERYLFEKDADYAYGTLYALPSEYTLKSYLPADEYNIFSQSSEKATNIAECMVMLENTVKHMKMPYGMGELVYASQLAAGLEMSRSLKRARRSEYCKSSVLRQLNDGRKTVSSAMLDYFNKPKATLKFVVDAYANVMLDVDPCVDNTVFWIVNSGKKPYSGRLVYALYDNKGKCYEEKNIELSLASGECKDVERADFSRYGIKADSLYILYELYDEKGIIASGSEHFVPIKHFEFYDPKITAQITGMGKKFSIKLNSEQYAYAIKVDFDGLNVNFSNNFVNLYGKTPVVIDFETAEVVTISELENKMRIYTPYCIGR